MKKAVIIVAGGSGKRMNSSLPKQFLDLGGMPVLMRTILCFSNFDPEIEIIVALPKDHIPFWHDLCKKHNFTINHKIAEGGSERFFSVRNALAQVSDDAELIGIHDGVRPLVSSATIQNCFDAALEHGASVPCRPVTDSIRELNASLSASHALNRSYLRAVQTPQCFRSKIINHAYQLDFNPKFTDDASVVESAGYQVVLVDSNAENIKITTPMDLALAEILLKQI